MNYLTSALDKTEDLLIRAKMEWMRFRDEMDGMETLQVMIIIAVALGVAAVVIGYVTKVQNASNTKVDNFMQEFGK